MKVPQSFETQKLGNNREPPTDRAFGGHEYIVSMLTSAAIALLFACACVLTQASSTRRGSHSALPGSSVWSGCVVVETSDMAATSRTLAVQIGWRGSATFIPVPALNSGAFIAISAALGPCGEYIVVFDRSYEVYSMAELNAWLEVCMEAGRPLQAGFAGCSIASPYFLGPRVIYSSNHTHVNTLPAFVAPAMVVSARVLLEGIGFARSNSQVATLPMHELLSDLCARYSMRVLYPAMPSHAQLARSHVAASLHCGEGITFLHTELPLTLHNWTLPLASKFSDGVVVPKEVGAFSDKLTIVIPTYKRLPTFLSTVAHYASLSFVHEIIGVWNDPDEAPPFTHASGAELAQLLRVKLPATGLAPVRILAQSENSLHNRFKHPDDFQIQTLAVMSLDDDVQISLSDVTRAFAVWRMAPDRLVGFDFTARGVRDRTGYDAGAGLAPEATHVYVHSKAKCDHLRTNRTLALTGAALFHVDWMALYSEPEPSAPWFAAFEHSWDVVESGFNGEDALFGFMVAAASGRGPVIVEGTKYNERVMKANTGLHHKPGHYGSRDTVVSQLIASFGDVLRRHAVPIGRPSKAYTCIIDPAPAIPPNQLCIHDLSTVIQSASSTEWSVIIFICICVVAAVVFFVRKMRAWPLTAARVNSIITSVQGKEHIV